MRKGYDNIIPVVIEQHMLDRRRWSSLLSTALADSEYIDMTTESLCSENLSDLCSRIRISASEKSEALYNCRMNRLENDECNLSEIARYIDGEFMISACDALERLLSGDDEEECVNAVKHGLAEKILSVRDIHIKDELVIKSVFGALAQLSNNTRNTDKLVEIGVPERVLATMKIFRKSTIIQILGLRVFRYLARGNGKYHSRFLKLGIAKKTISLMKLHRNDFSLQREACGTILCLTPFSNTNRLSFISLKAPEMISMALQAKDDDEKLTIQGLGALSNLSFIEAHMRPKSEFMRYKTGLMKICAPIIVTSSDMFPNSIPVHIFICSLLRNLTYESSENQEFVMKTFMDRILQLLEARADTDSIAQRICSIFANLSVNESLRDGLIEIQVIDKLVQAMDDHPYCEATQTNACEAFKYLSASSSLIASLISAKVDEKIFEALELHCISATFQHEAW
eukprot:CAMPEP_0184005888 /NCGR_PEP_ID=MMETSP0954-20121128/334_1 /TAXON_ID=627963 /ORGANISM="Aplanochytrium sp, Strain PBS07" /LENGTH=455 /DNA_ID=CAMNT_0026284269 /DNA_START=126 /DNA_END=1490 /DNA_ORIENTATION=+